MFIISDANGVVLPIKDSREHGGTHQNLMGAQLAGATLRGRFVDADFRGANLCGATFESARLTGANFANADLSDALFQAPIVTTGAIFRGANLTGAVPYWRSYEMFGEIVRQAAGTDADRLELADLILRAKDLTHGDWQTTGHPAFPWAHALCRAALRIRHGEEPHPFWRAMSGDEEPHPFWRASFRGKA